MSRRPIPPGAPRSKRAVPRRAGGGVSRALGPRPVGSAAKIIGFIVTYRTRVDTVAGNDEDADAIGVSLE
jgi:hypothetical protein